MEISFQDPSFPEIWKKLKKLKSPEHDLLTQPRKTCLARLGRQLWMRAMRRTLPGEPIHGGKRKVHEANWAPVAERILQAWPGHPALAMDVGLRGVLRVALKGIDPRRAARHLADHEVSDQSQSGAKRAKRRATGPVPRHDKKALQEWRTKIPIDLSARALAAFPEVPYWPHAIVLQLALPHFPRLDDLRLVLARLKRTLKLCNPLADVYRPYLSTEQYAALTNPSQRTERYQRGLQSIPRDDPTLELSLLAGLIAESWVTDQQALLDVHREAFKAAVDRLFLDPWMADLRTPFEVLVTAPILLCNWPLPAGYHISSVDEPFVPLEDLRALTGLDLRIMDV